MNREHGRDLADPAFEPSDEELAELAKRAFAHVRQAHEDSLQKLRAEIAAARAAAMERLRLRKGAGAAR